MDAKTLDVYNRSARTWALLRPAATETGWFTKSFKSIDLWPASRTVDGIPGGELAFIHRLIFDIV